MKSGSAESVAGKADGFIFAVAGTALVAMTLAPFQARINAMTAAFALLLVVLFAATIWGSRPALLGAILSAICLNFFFLTPLHTFTIADPQNWVAFIAYLITAITAGELSSRARRRAEEADAGRREIEQLYENYREASERARETEVLRQSEQLKSALLDAVTHDLRTPLTSIKAAATTLLDETDRQDPVALDDEARRELLEVIVEESDRLNRFVENLVELARIDAGALQLRRRWSSIEEIVTMALERARGLSREHRVITSLPGELPLVHVDANTIAEVVYSLIDNAAKYSPAGSAITVSAKVDGEKISIAVEDEGPGIPVEIREQVFGKFFRATTGGEKGLGMGMAIAKGIIEAHDGRIWIEDGSTGKGARVIFTLPIGDVND